MSVPLLWVSRCSDQYQTQVSAGFPRCPPVCVGYQEAGSSQSSEIMLLDDQYLSPDLIDSFAEVERDWISRSHPHQNVEVYSLSLLGVSGHEQLLKHSHMTIQEIVALTLQAPYHFLTIARERFYCYTCCLHVVGLGRVRLVIVFNNPQRTGNYAVLLTNRLAWSSRTVLTCWSRYYSFSDLYSSHIVDSPEVLAWFHKYFRQQQVRENWEKG